MSIIDRSRQILKGYYLGALSNFVLPYDHVFRFHWM